MTINPIPLSELQIGSSGTIDVINLKGDFKRRLLEMGFVRGAKIMAYRAAPFGDPIAYKVKGSQVSLRQVDAKDILIFRD